MKKPKEKVIGKVPKKFPMTEAQFRMFLAACKPTRRFRPRDSEGCPLQRALLDSNHGDLCLMGDLPKWAGRVMDLVDNHVGASITAAKVLQLMDTKGK